jgi:hypothetical protein
VSSLARGQGLAGAARQGQCGVWWEVACLAEGLTARARRAGLGARGIELSCVGLAPQRAWLLRRGGLAVLRDALSALVGGLRTLRQRLEAEADGAAATAPSDSPAAASGAASSPEAAIDRELCTLALPLKRCAPAHPPVLHRLAPRSRTHTLPSPPLPRLCSSHASSQASYSYCDFSHRSAPLQAWLPPGAHSSSPPLAPAAWRSWPRAAHATYSWRWACPPWWWAAARRTWWRAWASSSATPTASSRVGALALCQSPEPALARGLGAWVAGAGVPARGGVLNAEC